MSSQIEFEFSFIVNFPMGPEVVFFLAFSLLGTQNWSIFWREN